MFKNLFQQLASPQARTERQAREERITEIARQSRRASAALAQAHGEDITPFETRLRIVLDQAASDDLRKLQQEKVTVVLDRRLSRVGCGMTGHEIHAAYHQNQSGQKMLCLYDHGKRRHGFAQHSMRTYAGDVIHSACADILPDTGQGGAVFRLGYLIRGNGGHGIFKWYDGFRNGFDVIKYPELKQPPVSWECCNTDAQSQPQPPAPSRL